MSLQGKRIYLVEDNQDNIYVTLALLKKHGAIAIIDWWARGEARKILKALPLDLIILDLMLMGGHSGFDIFQELRTIPELDAIPIIAVSATDPILGVERTQELGFSGFISKPVDYERFPRQLEAIIAGQAVWNTDPDKPW